MPDSGTPYQIVASALSLGPDLLLVDERAAAVLVDDAASNHRHLHVVRARGVGQCRHRPVERRRVGLIEPNNGQIRILSRRERPRVDAAHASTLDRRHLQGVLAVAGLGIQRAHALQEDGLLHGLVYVLTAGASDAVGSQADDRARLLQGLQANRSRGQVLIRDRVVDDAHPRFAEPLYLAVVESDPVRERRSGVEDAFLVEPVGGTNPVGVEKDLRVVARLRTMRVPMRAELARQGDAVER